MVSTLKLLRSCHLFVLNRQPQIKIRKVSCLNFCTLYFKINLKPPQRIKHNYCKVYSIQNDYQMGSKNDRVRGTSLKSSDYYQPKQSPLAARKGTTWQYTYGPRKKQYQSRVVPLWAKVEVTTTGPAQNSNTHILGHELSLPWPVRVLPWPIKVLLARPGSLRVYFRVAGRGPVVITTLQ